MHCCETTREFDSTKCGGLTSRQRRYCHLLHVSCKLSVNTRCYVIDILVFDSVGCVASVGHFLYQISAPYSKAVRCSRPWAHLRQHPLCIHSARIIWIEEEPGKCADGFEHPLPNSLLSVREGSQHVLEYKCRSST